jgi:hypothetical protein
VRYTGRSPKSYIAIPVYQDVSKRLVHENTLLECSKENSLFLLVVGLVTQHGVSAPADLQLDELDKMGCSIRNK